MDPKREGYTHLHNNNLEGHVITAACEEYRDTNLWGHEEQMKCHEIKDALSNAIHNESVREKIIEVVPDLDDRLHFGASDDSVRRYLTDIVADMNPIRDDEIVKFYTYN